MSCGACPGILFTIEIAFTKHAEMDYNRSYGYGWEIFEEGGSTQTAPCQKRRSDSQLL